MLKFEMIRPTIEEYNYLRNSVDWSLKEKGISNDRAKKSLIASPFCVTVYDDFKVIGMCRISGDKTMYGYLQDIIIIPEYQRKGIGTKMLKILLKDVSKLKGYLLGVCPSRKSAYFYKTVGFRKRKEKPNGFMYKEI